MLAAAGCEKERPLPQSEAPAGVPRIVSFAPSLTQIIFDMGFGSHVVGVTSQCDLPEGVERPRLGDALSVNPEAIIASKPDIVLIQMAPAKMDPVRKMAPDIRIEHFKIETLEDIGEAIERISSLVGCEDIGRMEREHNFDNVLQSVRQRVAGLDRPRVLFVYGTNRPGSAGKGTFIDEMITTAGGENAAANYSGWIKLNLEQIIVADPEVIICQATEDSAESARDYWLAVESISAARTGRVHVITDRHLTIPSTRSPEFVARIAVLIHPKAGEKGSN